MVRLLRSGRGGAHTEKAPVPVVPMALKGMWSSMWSRRDTRLGRMRLPRRLRAHVEVVAAAPLPGAEVDAPTLEAQVRELRGDAAKPAATCTASPRQHDRLGFSTGIACPANPGHAVGLHICGENRCIMHGATVGQPRGTGPAIGLHAQPHRRAGAREPPGRTTTLLSSSLLEKSHERHPPFPNDSSAAPGSIPNYLVWSIIITVLALCLCCPA